MDRTRPRPGNEVTEVFDSGDAELKTHFEGLAAKHLEVLNGDLSEPDLGLSFADWQRLSETVDLIVHPAALVNHVLPYQSLFGPNVVGTAELIRLAITHQQKPIVNVSTVAAAMLPGGVLDEDADVRTATPVRMLDSGRYADGRPQQVGGRGVVARGARPLPVAGVGIPLRHDPGPQSLPGQINIPEMLPAGCPVSCSPVWRRSRSIQGIFP